MNPKINLIWKNLDIKSKDHQILTNCSGKIENSKISILLGGIGAGKSVLLNTLVGRIHNNLEIKGEVLINNKKNEIDKLISLVDETFYFFQKQTVWETLFFAVKFYNFEKPTNFIIQKTKKIINLLDLKHVALEMLINLSNGEKKLLSLGVVLAEDSAIILLDEPFEFLDKWHVLRILKILKKLAETSKTILLSLNIADSTILENCDKIFILANQTIIFEGTYKKYENFFNKKNIKADEFVTNLLAIDYSKKILEVRKIQKIREIRDQCFLDEDIKINTTNYFNITYKNQRSSFRKIGWLLKRHLQILFRSKESYMSIIIQKTTFLILACIVYPFIGYFQEDIQTRIGLLGFLILNSIDRSMSIVLASFSHSKLVTKREIVVGMYTSIEIYFAEFIFDFVLIYISTVLYIIPVYWIAQVNNNIYRFILFLINHFFLVNFTVAYSLFIGIISPSPKTAHMFGSVGLLIFSAFSGIFVNVNTIPHFSRWLTWISPMYYALEFSLQISLSNLTFICNSESCYRNGQEVLENIGMNRLGKYISLSIFILYVLFFILLGIFFIVKDFHPRMINEKVDVWKYFLFN